MLVVMYMIIMQNATPYPQDRCNGGKPLYSEPFGSFWTNISPQILEMLVC